MLVKVCHVEGKQKLGDRWESQPYIVVKKQPGLPVYVVQPEGGGSERVLHRNLLTQCMFLPVERGVTLTIEEDESVGMSDIELEEGDKVVTESENSLTEIGNGTPTQVPKPPRRNPKRIRRPPVKLSLEAQVVPVESLQQKIERGRNLWLQEKNKRSSKAQAQRHGVHSDNG